MPWPPIAPDAATERAIAHYWSAGLDTVEIAKRIPPLSEAQVYSVVNRIVADRRAAREARARL